MPKSSTKKPKPYPSIETRTLPISSPTFGIRSSLSSEIASAQSLNSQMNFGVPPSIPTFDFELIQDNFFMEGLDEGMEGMDIEGFGEMDECDDL